MRLRLCRFFGGRGSPAVNLMLVALLSFCSVEGKVEGKLSHSKDCRARDLTTFLVSLMQRELPDWEWDCDIENLHVSVFPYLSLADASNLCFIDPKARAILLWKSPSVEFVKDYLSVVCMILIRL